MEKLQYKLIKNKYKEIPGYTEIPGLLREGTAHDCNIQASLHRKIGYPVDMEISLT